MHAQPQLGFERICNITHLVLLLLIPKGRSPFFGPFLGFGTLDRPLWMQSLSKKSQIFGEHVV
jgi:hypothetical protein